MRWVLPLVAMTLGAGCRGSAPPPPAPAPPHPVTFDGDPGETLSLSPFGVPGEQMRYHIRWRGVLIGTVEVAVGQPGKIGGRRAIIVTSRAESDGVVAMVEDAYYQLTTTLDLDDGMPIETKTSFAAKVHGKHEKGGTTRTWHQRDLHNAHTLIGQLRAWDPRDGERRTVEVRAGSRFTLQLIASEHRVHRGPTGRHPAIRIDGRAGIGAGYDVTFWMSNDRHRLLLEADAATRYGPVTVELVRYTPPE